MLVTSSSRYDIDVSALPDAEEVLVTVVAARRFLEDGRFVDKRTPYSREPHPASTWNCINASRFLAELLNQADTAGRWQAYTGSMSPGVNGHAFVLGHDEVIADITADQFAGFPHVLLKPLTLAGDYEITVKDPLDAWWPDLPADSQPGKWLAEWRGAEAVYRANARWFVESFRAELFPPSALGL